MYKCPCSRRRAAYLAVPAIFYYSFIFDIDDDEDEWPDNRCDCVRPLPLAADNNNETIRARQQSTAFTANDAAHLLRQATSNAQPRARKQMPGWRHVLLHIGDIGAFRRNYFASSACCVRHVYYYPPPPFCAPIFLDAPMFIARHEGARQAIRDDDDYVSSFDIFPHCRYFIGLPCFADD